MSSSSGGRRQGGRGNKQSGETDWERQTFGGNTRLPHPTTFPSSPTIHSSPFRPLPLHFRSPTELRPQRENAPVAQVRASLPGNICLRETLPDWNIRRAPGEQGAPFPVSTLLTFEIRRRFSGMEERKAGHIQSAIRDLFRPQPTLELRRARAALIFLYEAWKLCMLDVIRPFCQSVSMMPFC